MTFDINYFQDEDGIFTAIVSALKGCIVSGEALKEAYENATDAIESCLEARKELGMDKTKKSKYAKYNRNVCKSLFL